MFKLGVIFAALSVVSADVGLGYHYKVPQTSYGVPSYQLGGSSGHYNPTFASSSASSISTGPYKVQAAPGGHLGSNYAQSTTGYQTISSALPASSNFNSFNSGFGHGSASNLANGLSSGFSHGSSSSSGSGLTGSNSGFSSGSGSSLGSGLSGDSNSGFSQISGSTVSSGLSSGVNSGFSHASGSGLSSGSNSGFNHGIGSSVSGLNSGFSQGSGSSLSSTGGSLYYPVSTIASVSQPTYQVSSTPAPGFFNQYQTSNQYQTQQNYQQYYEVKEQPAQVYKHFYVHSVPEEPEPLRPRVPIVLPPPQKHYKIIFVKAPGQIRTSQIVQVPQPQNEEKTIVYVLVKKPEDRTEVIVPKVEQKAPSKPEVYYIKYNNKQDSQSVINNIVSDYNKGQPLTVSNTAGSEGFYDASTILNHPSTSGVSSGPISSSSFLAPSDSSAFLAGSTPSYTTFVTGYKPSPATFVTGSYPSSTTFLTGASPISSGYVSGANPTSTGFGSGLFSSSGYLNNPSTHGSTGFLTGHPVTGSNVHHSTVSNFGTLSDAAAESQVSNGSYETQTYDVSSGSVSGSPSLGVSTIDNDEETSGTISSTVIPVITSSTANYDQLNTISTSQGIPHETYGSPKFREE